MKKREKKLLKLMSRAQDCTSRKKAVKILKKMTKMSEETYRCSKDPKPPKGV